MDRRGGGKPKWGPAPPLEGEPLPLHEQPPPPAAPSGLTATVVAGGVRLSWTSSSRDEADLRIEQRVGLLGTFVEMGRVRANATTFTDGGAPSGLLFYRVRACNAAGYSAYSDTAFVFKR